MRALLFLLVLASSTVAAQTPGSCEPGTAQGDLDVSNVFARVFNTGSLFFGNATTAGDGYTVPKFSGNSPLFAAGLWIAGEVEGEVRSAGSRYSNFTFWPGPLGDGATLPDPDDCSAYDRIYVVSRGDVARYEGGEEPSADLAEWPVGLGAPAVTAGGAPVEPASREQVIDLAAGERPVLYGSQTAWWVMNDVGNEHTQQQTEPLGIEVRVSAFSVASAEVAGAMESTFYRYEVLNRGTSAIENARAGFFIDPDLGDAVDDYVGSDSTRGMFFAYNADDDDASYGTPPALGIDLLSGAGSTMYMDSGASGPTIDPVLGTEYYTYLQSRWKDGTPLYEFRDGYDEPMASVTQWAFPGDPVTGAFWSEVNNDGNGTANGAGDRRGLAIAPEFDLAPGGTYTLDVGVLFAQGSDRFDSITELRAVSDAVQAAYDDGSLFELGGEVSFLPAPVLLAPAASADLGVQTSVRFEWEPVSGADGYLLKWSDQPEGPFTDQVLAAEASISVPLQTLDLASGYSEVYWRVEAQSESQYGLPSETRAFRVFRNGALSLPDGTPAYLEVQNAEGSALCETGSDDPGCALTGGRENAVYLSLNSTGTYYFAEQGPGSEPQLALYGPKDFEIRFTDEGSLAGYLFQPPFNVIRVPFEIWDIGVVAPGEANDPADDVRLIPFLFADGGGTCAFDYGESEEATFGHPATDRINAYYPATSYADFEAAFVFAVQEAPENCYSAGSQAALLDFTTGPRPIQRQVFADYAGTGELPGTGTVVRMYTQDPESVASEPSAPDVDLALTVGPNPSVGDAVARFTLAASGPVTVRVVDVLGREVAVLSQGARSAGTHALPLPASLAAGVYAVEVRTPTATASRMLTVVR